MVVSILPFARRTKHDAAFPLRAHHHEQMKFLLWSLISPSFGETIGLLCTLADYQGHENDKQ
jgi:hypothetical protein